MDQMEVTFLGTGSAWGLPEFPCRCAVCSTMRKLGEERTRTSLLVKARELILVDCGPDIRKQLHGRLDRSPDAILITHSHGDHTSGLDELVAFKRIMEKESWRPIPTYATEETWARLERVFGYLVGDVLEKRIARIGEPLDGLETKVEAFATDHGPVAKGSVGYVLEERTPLGWVRILYTSDFEDLPQDPPIDGQLHAAIIQSHWLHEPSWNRPHHMSFQRAMDYLRRWNPENAFLVHISDEYLVDGDPFPKGLKAVPPKSPMLDPSTGLPYPQPLCHEDWQETVSKISADLGLGVRPQVAMDGLKVEILPGKRYG